MQVGYGAEWWPVKTHSSEKEKKYKIVVMLIQEEVNSGANSLQLFTYNS